MKIATILLLTFMLIASSLAFRVKSKLDTAFPTAYAKLLPRSKLPFEGSCYFF